MTTELSEGHGFHYKGIKYVHHSDLHLSQSAFHRFSGLQILIITLSITVFMLGLFINWHTTLVCLMAFITILYFADLLFNLYLIYRSFSKPLEITISESELGAVKEEEWPTYTVLCPLYKEWQIIPQFVSAMSRLDYPKDKLQVMLLLEEGDNETIKQVNNFNLPNYFNVVIVPHSIPKTKPKACNYGLKHATGDYIVIYDAEDIPDSLQLKKAVLAFKRAGDRVVCIQAKLNFYNPHQNLLTRLFTAEYSLWFDLVLTGLQSIHAPIPLGGTSNHFKKSDLNKLKGWDSFNVTEDADLGMRLVKRGYRTAVIDSITLEEANSGMFNWYGQRTRWIKGYIQTYFLHMRNISEFNRTWKEPHFITFQLVVGGKVTSMLINPLMWVTTISYFAFRAHIGTFIESFFSTPILYMGVISFLLGNFLYMYYYMIGCKKHGHHELVKYAILVPFYWLAMSIAAWMATYSFIIEPHYWSKTKHGLHLKKNKVAVQLNEEVKESFITTPSYISNTISGLSIVLPAYNEELNITPMVDKVDSFMKTLQLDYEIIVVNDGSKDKTKAMIDTIALQNKRIVAIHHKTNYGYGSALRSGFNAATKDWIFFTDSDLQFDISEITKLIEKSNNAKMIIGFRKNRQDPLFRIINANLYKATLRLLFGLKVKDIDCAFKLFAKEIINKCQLTANGAIINAELLIKTKNAGIKMTQVAVNHYPRLRGNPTGACPKVVLRAMKELIVFRFANTI